jgi:hypothetical protein
MTSPIRRDVVERQVLEDQRQGRAAGAHDVEVRGACRRPDEHAAEAITVAPSYGDG